MTFESCCCMDILVNTRRGQPSKKEVIQLMEEIRRENHLGCIPNLVNNGIFSSCFPSTGDLNAPDFWTSHQLRYGMMAPWCFVVETKRLPEVGKWRPMLKLYHYFESPLGKWSNLTWQIFLQNIGCFKRNHPAGWVGIDCQSAHPSGATGSAAGAP